MCEWQVNLIKDIIKLRSESQENKMILKRIEKLWISKKK